MGDGGLVAIWIPGTECGLYVAEREAELFPVRKSSPPKNSTSISTRPKTSKQRQHHTNAPIGDHTRGIF